MTKVVRLTEGHEERFRVEDSEVRFGVDEKTKRRTFKATAYTGKDVGRFWGRMVINSSGLKRDEKMGMLLEHHDLAPVAVCEKHEVDKSGKVDLEGYFLSDKASEHASKVIARADEGWPWKMSVGVRFLKWHDLEEGADEEVNGRKFAGPITIIDEAQLFETSFIHVSPADWDTNAAVLRKESLVEKKPENQVALAAALPAETREQILAEGERLATEKRKKYREGLKAIAPGKRYTNFRIRMLRENKPLEEVSRLFAEEVLKENKQMRKEKREQVLAQEALAEQFEHTGSGHNSANSEVIGYAPADEKQLALMKPEDRVSIEFVNRPVLSELWGEESARAYLGALKKRFKIPECANRRLDTHDGLVESMSHAVFEAALANKDHRFYQSNGGKVERLGVGKSGPDLSKIVVKGFIGTFYQSYEEEYTSAWAQKLSYQIPSDQETEIVRWLAAPPQLEEWVGPRIAKDLPIYTQLLVNKLFESTLDIDKFDWANQKFGLLTRSLGEMGAVASQHWDLIFSLNLIEANPTAYDGKAFFAKTHTLGGDSGTMINDLVSSGGFPQLAVADPANPTQLEAARILLACVPQLRTFKWANGIPINGTARKFAVMVPSVNPVLEGVFLAATRNERLDLGQTNPLFATGHNWEVIPNPYLTSPKYVYIFRLDTPRTPFLRAEPGPIEMQFMGPGTTYAFDKHKYAMGLESTRGIAPGAWESALRLTVGAA